MALTRNTIIKIIELVLTIICFFLHYQTFEANDYHGLFITTGTYFAYIIILVGVFIGAFSGNPVNKSIDMWFCLIGAILFLASAVFSYSHFSGWTFRNSTANQGLVKAWLSAANAVLLLVDGVFTFRGE
ncbi:hypothetical protein M8J76_010135 [Diaphorina citri]|nr:hypothetical protein M8J75_004670 [Diaphorina citri]KAI5723726.1 hypothetical protein M8J76_010135 [Diaphorina citri]KAI5728491.1 hypothetical protein M8J77_016898 [Diaphorina citri]